jgi:integrase
VLGSYVFCSPEGRFLHNLERDWRPALEKAKIPDFRFHDCRHTFASRLAMTPGVDLYTVQRAGVEESGHGAAVRLPQPGLREGRRRADGQEPIRGWNRHENRH